MEQVTEGIHRLGRKHHNFYVAVDGGRATVVDTGGSRELPLLEKGLRELGLTLDAVEAVLVTHAHTDHIGSARRLSDRGFSVKVHEAEARYARDRSAGSQVGIGDLPWWTPRVIAFLAEMVGAGAARAAPVPNVETVTDGERLDLPGRPRGIATPGHTAGPASHLLEDRRALCAGDALVTDSIIRSGTGPQLLPDVFQTDPARARASLANLAGLDADLLLPGHGRPWQGSIAEAVARARG